LPSDPAVKTFGLAESICRTIWIGECCRLPVGFPLAITDELTPNWNELISVLPYAGTVIV
jgi:hypothetical protein